MRKRNIVFSCIVRLHAVAGGERENGGGVGKEGGYEECGGGQKEAMSRWSRALINIRGETAACQLVRFLLTRLPADSTVST